MTDIIPPDWQDAIITFLFKKGHRGECGTRNYRGISLLGDVEKVFGHIMLQRLQLLAERLYPQSQSGLWKEHHRRNLHHSAANGKDQRATQKAVHSFRGFCKII